jgi:hypothetical protein
MDVLFGLGTAQQRMTVLLVLLGLALLYVLLLGLRRRIIFNMGVRNITRRPGQTALIVLGLTLSTVIIVSALSIGDTLSYSVRRHAVDAYGEIDQVISPPLLSALAGLAADAGQGDDPTASWPACYRETCSASWGCSRRDCQASAKSAMLNCGTKPRQTRPLLPWWTGWLLPSPSPPSSGTGPAARASPWLSSWR